jgi:hypothetical protein
MEGYVRNCLMAMRAGDPALFTVDRACGENPIPQLDRYAIVPLEDLANPELAAKLIQNATELCSGS